MKRGTLFWSHTHTQENTEINLNMIEIMEPYRFPMGSWSGIGASTLLYLCLMLAMDPIRVTTSNEWTGRTDC